MKVCFSCSKELNVETRPARSDTCPSCTADLKVCRNCAFHDKGAYNECREPAAERVVDKERANFCDYFRFRDGEGAGGGDARSEARRKLGSLFGDSS